jgi:hypothetical protein
VTFWNSHLAPGDALASASPTVHQPATTLHSRTIIYFPTVHQPATTLHSRTIIYYYGHCADATSAEAPSPSLTAEMVLYFDITGSMPGYLDEVRKQAAELLKLTRSLARQAPPL